jgi:hypothetical protein
MPGPAAAVLYAAEAVVVVAVASCPNASRWSAMKSELLSQDQYSIIKSAFAVCYILWRL